MADPNDMAKLYYTMQTVTEMRYGGRTDAYVEFRDGKNRSAQTGLYEKLIRNNLLCPILYPGSHGYSCKSPSEALV